MWRQKKEKNCICLYAQKLPIMQRLNLVSPFSVPETPRKYVYVRRSHIYVLFISRLLYFALEKQFMCCCCCCVERLCGYDTLVLVAAVDVVIAGYYLSLNNSNNQFIEHFTQFGWACHYTLYSGRLTTGGRVVTVAVLIIWSSRVPVSLSP